MTLCALYMTLLDISWFTPDSKTHLANQQDVGDSNFGKIFLQEHVEFIDRLKNVRKHSAEDDGEDGDHTKKQR
ncbi:hypothetical protein BGZ52_000895, partial [Haplosporangium bisporale]